MRARPCNRWPQSGTLRLTLVASLALCCLISSPSRSAAAHWALFDSLGATGRQLPGGDYLQPNLHFGPPPINLPTLQTQLLTPATGPGQPSTSGAPSQSPFGVQLSFEAPHAALQSDSPGAGEPRLAPKLAPEEKQVAPPTALEPRAAALAAVEPQQQPAEGPAPQRSGPSPAGKILEAVQVASSQAASPASANESQPAGEAKPSNSSASARLSSAALQLLKARKQSAREQVSSAEQQIINQHARAHHPHHLLASKHRDHQLAALLADAPSGASAAASSLRSLLGNFRSGMSSRSSIVKAISDNKLARSK